MLVDVWEDNSVVERDFNIPVVSGVGIVTGVIQLAIVTLLAMLYPTRVATKITPLEAISRD